MTWEIADRDHPRDPGPRFSSLGDPALVAAMDRARPRGRFYVRWVAEEETCRHCGRAIVLESRWIDPEATGDDEVWRETCDAHDTFTAEHEPIGGDA
jgi:hypothetical protein